MLQPLQAYLQTERSGAVFLLAATVIALGWANSPWGATYERFWHQSLSVHVGSLSITADFRHWVNEGLMALFFLVVGLELKREFVTGDLRDPRAVALPVIAAVGGMLAPAAIYLSLNPSGSGMRGWGIPMATDIAFALGVLTLALGKSHHALKSMLLTLAIVDDVGAILVIAVFYSSSVEMLPLAVVAALLVAIALLQTIQVRWTPVYIALGVGVWLATYRSGVHAAIAGVALGLLTPARPFQRPKAVSAQAHRIADETVDDPEPPDADAAMWLELAALSRGTVSPLARIENLLHPWTSFVVLPLFALADAGIAVSVTLLQRAATSTVAVGIVLALAVGKPLGVVGSSWVARRLRVEGPTDLTLRDVAGVGTIAGVGFTVSLFIVALAFPSAGVGDEARIAVLFGSTIAGVVGWIVLRRYARQNLPN